MRIIYYFKCNFENLLIPRKYPKLAYLSYFYKSYKIAYKGYKTRSPSRRLCPTRRRPRISHRTCRAVLTAYFFHLRVHFHQKLNITLKTLWRYWLSLRLLHPVFFSLNLFSEFTDFLTFMFSLFLHVFICNLFL